MKVLFLDLDGVLNSLDFLRNRQGRFHSGTFVERVCFSIDPLSIPHLNAIIDETGCQLVLSSTWRNGDRWTDVIEGLRRRGVRGHFLGRTPAVTEQDFSVFERYTGRRPQMMEPYPRGYEIQQWLDKHRSVTSFVIVDDDDDMAHLSDRLVRTDPVVGLQSEDAKRAIELLNVPCQVDTATSVNPA